MNGTRLLKQAAAVLLGGWVSGSAMAAESPEVEAKGVFFVVPHTHWEGAVFKTREEYLEIGLTHILTAVRLLKEHPDYRFALDQAAYFRPFVERYPSEAAAFRQFIAEGRLEIVGGLNVMPDDNIPSGESFIRQMLYAKGYCRAVLGTEVKTGWMVDTFGHHAQMPQLLRLGGFDTFWFSRGVEDRSKMPPEFQWQGIDGTRIKTFWLPNMYGNFAFPPGDMVSFDRYTKDRYNELDRYDRANRLRVGYNGADVTDPELFMPAMVQQFNAKRDQPFALRLAVPHEIAAAMAGQTNLPVVTGERNPLFQGVYSSRIELKQRMREMERILTSAEKLGATASWLGKPGDSYKIERAWDAATFNVTHDLCSGVMTDPVYEDTIRSYNTAEALATDALGTALDAVLARVNTAGNGVPIAVFNTLGWSRTDIAEGDVGFATGGIVEFDLIDSGGIFVPAQIVSDERFDDGGLRRIKFIFVARDVPAMGHAIYHVVPRKGAGVAKQSVADSTSGEVETTFLRASFDLKNGTLTSLKRKDGDWESLSGPANNIAAEPDHGDVWELYHNLDGAQTTIMTRPMPVPKAGDTLFSSAGNSTNGVVRRGPVFTEVEVTSALGTNLLTAKTRIYNGINRVEFETHITNHDRFLRYRALFPTTITRGRNIQEIPFGSIERPQSQEFPAQNWIDYSDGANGVALLNRGNPGNNVSDGTLMLSLMRSTRIQSYGIGGGFEGQSSDSALELGKELVLRYALLPHKGSWQDAGIVRAGLEFNQPLIVRKVAPHPGTLASRWGFINISAPNAVLTSVKESKDGTTIFRIYESSGHATSGVKIVFTGKSLTANEANLLEDTGAKLKIRDNSVQFDLHPFEIKTLKVKLSRAP